jgi:hypothetical protein
VKSKIAKDPFKYAFIGLLFGFIGLSPLAVISSHLALSKIKNSDIEYPTYYRRMVHGGLLLGYLGLFIWLYFLFLFIAMAYDWDISFLFPFGINV